MDEKEGAVARKYFGTDGIRGKVGEPHMSADFVLRLGQAAGRVLAAGGTGSILIGKDTRISGYMFESALEAGFVAAGLNVRLLGPMPTPGVAYLTKTFRATAGVVISASHNPFDDNGLKFFAPQGGKLADDVEEAIEAALEEPFRTVSSSGIGKVSRVLDAQGRYVEFCKSKLGPGLSLQGLNIVLDCANGATYQVAPLVFSELGAEVVATGIAPDGLNINRDCGSMHPEALQRVVVETAADLGLAFDGDGDRVLMVDGRGRLMDGDDIIYAIARSRQAAGLLPGPVIGTVMSNLGLEQALSALGVPFERTKVGDRYVLEALQTCGGTLGGEPSGHVICLDRTSTGDGIISALQVLNAMVTAQASLDEVCAGMTKYPQVLLNVRTHCAAAALADRKVEQAVRDVEAELGGRGRVVLRASGTEPLVRVMVEGENARQVQRLAAQIADMVKAAGSIAAAP